MRMDGAPKLFREISADAGHGVEVEGEVVDGVEGCAEGLAGDEEVAQVGAGVAAADEAGACGVDGGGVFGVFEALDVHADDAAGLGFGGGFGGRRFVGVDCGWCWCCGERFAGLGAAEEEAVAPGAGGQDAVHHVDAHAGVLLDLVGVADAHDVAGLVGGEEFEGAGDHLARNLAGFADGEAADGVAVEVHLDEALGGLAAEVGVHAALDDAEEGLGCFELLRPGNFVLVGVEVGLGACGPGVGEGHGVAGAFVRGRGLDALVEGHQDVGTEGDLDFDGVLGREEMRGAVEVGAELDAFGCDFS